MDLLRDSHRFPGLEDLRMLLDVLDVVVKRRPMRILHLAGQVDRDRRLPLLHAESLHHVVALVHGNPVEAVPRHGVDQALGQDAAKPDRLDPVLRLPGQAALKPEFLNHVLGNEGRLGNVNRQISGRERVLLDKAHIPAHAGQLQGHPRSDVPRPESGKPSPRKKPCCLLPRTGSDFGKAPAEERVRAAGRVSILTRETHPVPAVLLGGPAAALPGGGGLDPSAQRPGCARFP